MSESLPLATIPSSTAELQAGLESIGDLTVTGNEMLYVSAPNVYSTINTTAAGRELVGKTGISGIQSYIGLVPGTNVQQYSDGLLSIASLGTAANKILYTTGVDTYAETGLSSYVRGLLSSTNATNLATAASLISSPGSSTDNTIVRWNGADGTAIQSSSIVIDDSDNITGVVSINSITTNALAQLGNIASKTLSGTSWSYLEAMNQSIATTDDVVFNSLSITTTLTVAGVSSIAAVNMNNNKITNLATPTASTDATTKAYVDLAATGSLTSIESADIASTTNLTGYTGNTIVYGGGLPVVDGVTMSGTERVLIKDQNVLLQNGVYSRTSSTVLTRITGFDTGDTVTKNTNIVVSGGTINAATSWNTTSDITTVGTNNVSWALFSTQSSAGNGLSQSGGSLNVNTVGTSGNIYVNGSDQIDINGGLSIAKGGTNAVSYTANRLLAYNSGGTVFETTTIDPSIVVQTNVVQTLTNKTIDDASNNITANALSNGIGAKIDINNVATVLGQVPKVSSITPLQLEWSAESAVVDINGLSAETTAANSDEIVIYDTSATANKKMTRANFLAGITATLPSGVSIVAAANGDYTTISAAITALSAGSTIVVYPGTYSENLNINKNIRIIGYPAAQNIIINGADTTSSRVTFTSNATSATLREVTVISPSSGANFAIDISATILGSLIVLATVAIVGGGSAGSGVLCSNAGITASIDGLFHNGGALNVFLQCTGGLVTIANGIGAVGSCTDYFKITGGVLQVKSYILLNSTVYSGVDLFDISAGTLEADSILIPSLSPFTNGVHIAGDGVSIFMTGSHLHSTAYNILADGGLTGTNSDISIQGIISYEQTLYPANYKSNTTRFILSYLDRGIKDDSHIKIEGGLAVGSPDNPSELVAGEGDSTTVFMNVLTSTDVTDIAGATYVNVTEIANNRSDSNFTLFPALINKSGVFIGNTERMFSGCKIDNDTAQVDGSGTTTWWYYNGSAWIETLCMRSASSYPYTQYAAASSGVAQSEQLRLNFNIMISNWAKISVNGISAYWVFCRVGRDSADSVYPNTLNINTTSITTSAIVRRIKLHTNRTEINGDGVIEFFGKSQPLSQLILSEKLEMSGSPRNASSLDLSTELNNLVVLNGRLGNIGDSIGYIVVIQPGIDTSKNVHLTVDWIPRSNNTGNVELIGVLVTPIQATNNLDSGNITEQTITNVIAVSNQSNDLFRTVFDFIIPHALVSDCMVCAVKLGANTTFTGNVTIFDVGITAIKWRLS